MYNIYVERKVKIMSIENSKKYEEIIKNQTLKVNEEFQKLSEDKKNDSLFEKVDDLYYSYSDKPYLFQIPESYALCNKGKRRIWF